MSRFEWSSWVKSWHLTLFQMRSEMDIDKLRKKIDEVDAKILDLLNQSAKTAEAIGK